MLIPDFLTVLPNACVVLAEIVQNYRGSFLLLG